MQHLPYYKAYPVDFMRATIRMPGELRCAYRLLLDLIYFHSGECPDDLGYVAGNLGYSSQKWVHMRRKLIETGKIEIAQTPDGPVITNERATREIRAAHDAYAAKVRAAKMGAVIGKAGRPSNISPIRGKKTDGQTTDEDAEGGSVEMDLFEINDLRSAEIDAERAPRPTGRSACADEDERPDDRSRAERAEVMARIAAEAGFPQAMNRLDRAASAPPDDNRLRA